MSACASLHGRPRCPRHLLPALGPLLHDRTPSLVTSQHAESPAHCPPLLGLPSRFAVGLRYCPVSNRTGTVRPGQAGRMMRPAGITGPLMVTLRTGERLQLQDSLRALGVGGRPVKHSYATVCTRSTHPFSRAAGREGRARRGCGVTDHTNSGSTQLGFWGRPSAAGAACPSARALGRPSCWTALCEAGWSEREVRPRV